MPSNARALFFASFATLIAGFVDAVGYAHLGGLFLSFMSGNSTRLGIQLAEMHWSMAGLTATIITSFVAGAFAGTRVADAAGDWKLVRILAVEVVLFTAAATLTGIGTGFHSLVPVALAMGMQNSVHQIVAGADVGKSFVTGALFGLGQSLARLASGKSRPSEAVSYALSWGCFVVGAGIGALTLSGAGLTVALAGAAVLLAGLALTGWAFHAHLHHPVGESGGD